MIGEKAYQNAMKRRAELRQELNEIETFLRLCDRFAGLPSGSEPDTQEQGASIPAFIGDPATTEHVAADIRTVTGADLLPYIRKMALDLGRPVSRGAVRKQLSRDGLRLNAKDESNYIGTVLWRARDQFVHLKPHGYWPTDVPYAPAGYNPGQDHETSSDDEDQKENGSGAVSGRSSADLWGTSNVS